MNQKAFYRAQTIYSTTANAFPMFLVQIRMVQKMPETRCVPWVLGGFLVCHHLTCNSQQRGNPDVFQKKKRHTKRHRKTGDEEMAYLFCFHRFDSLGKTWSKTYLNEMLCKPKLGGGNM